MVIYLDMGILVAGWLLAQLLFNGYETHVPPARRVGKLSVLFAIFLAIHRLAGRGVFYALLLLMSVGIGILHGYWFHVRHGIHWRTAEPRDRYLRLIGAEVDD